MKKIIITLVTFSCAFTLLISPVHAKEIISNADVQGSFEMLMEENTSTRASFTGTGVALSGNKYFIKSGAYINFMYK